MRIETIDPPKLQRSPAPFQSEEVIRHRVPLNRAEVDTETAVVSKAHGKANINVVLAESYPLLLAGMDHLLMSHGDLRVVARCADGDEAVRAVRQHRPDVLVSDLRLPVKNGLRVLRDLSTEGLRTRVVLLAERIYKEEMLEAVRLGAKGVILKDMSGSLLVRCILKVHAGGTWLEQQSIGCAVAHLLHRDAGAREVVRLLTRREFEVLQLAATGMHNNEIGARLNITDGTVKIHLHNMYEKLDVKGRLNLILRARDRGWV
jgi:two-component system nitrate/nitrite response regulator NarL